jgi:hypothetical protein
MPPTFLDSETCLLVLRNLMKAAYERQKAPTQPAGAAVK